MMLSFATVTTNQQKFLHHLHIQPLFLHQGVALLSVPSLQDQVSALVETLIVLTETASQHCFFYTRPSYVEEEM